MKQPAFLKLLLFMLGTAVPIALWAYMSRSVMGNPLTLFIPGFLAIGILALKLGSLLFRAPHASADNEILTRGEYIKNNFWKATLPFIPLLVFGFVRFHYLEVSKVLADQPSRIDLWIQNSDHVSWFLYAGFAGFIWAIIRLAKEAECSGCRQ